MEDERLHGSTRLLSEYAEKAAALASFISINGATALGAVHWLERKYGAGHSAEGLVRCAVMDLVRTEAKREFAYTSTGNQNREV